MSNSIITILRIGVLKKQVDMRKTITEVWHTILDKQQNIFL